MIEVQRGSWPGWPDGVSLQLADDAAAWWLQAVHDYRAETGRTDGQIILPAGALRLPAWVTEMQWGFDHRNDRPGTASRAQSDAIYTKYNMLRSSNARPSSTSQHLKGYCADAAGATFLAWMVANGARYGWKRTLVAEGDLPHFEYFPGTATAALNVIPINNTEDDMPGYSILAADDAPLLNTWAYVGLPESFIFSADPATNLAQKQMIAAVNGGITVAALEATKRDITSVGMQNLMNLIAAGRPTTALDSAAVAAALAPLIGHTDETALAAAVAQSLASQLQALPAAIVRAEGAALLNG